MKHARGNPHLRRSGSTAGRPRPVRAAPFWRRLLAGAVDLVLIAGLSAAIGYFVLSTDLLPPQQLPWLDHLADLVLHRWRLLVRWSILGCGLGTTYLVSFHGLLARTPGDWLLGLRLAGPDGAAAHPFRAILRTMLLVPLVLCLGAGFWWAAADRQRRALYDRLSGSHLLHEVLVDSP